MKKKLAAASVSRITIDRPDVRERAELEEELVTVGCPVVEPLRPLGGPLGSPNSGDGAQGHWRGIDCNAANGKTPITPLNICVK